MRILSRIIVIMLWIIPLDVMAGDERLLAPARLSDRDIISLQTDIVAKAISQKRLHYLKMVLGEQVNFGVEVLTKSSTIKKIRGRQMSTSAPAVR